MNSFSQNKSKIFTIVYWLFVFFIVVPVIYTFGSALFFDGTLTSNLKLFTKETLLLLLNSSIIAFIVAVITTFLGTGFGFLLYKTNIKFNSLFKILFLIPLLISPYILAVAWKDFFSIFSLNFKIINSYFGVVLVLTFIYTPLAILIIGSAFSNIESHLEESGLLITNLKRVVFHIVFPLVKPAILSSFVLIFIFSISEFSIPAFFGVKVFTTEIFTQFSAFYNHSFAILQSTLLVFICIALLLTESKYISEAPFLSVGSKGSEQKIYKLSREGLFLFLLIGWFLISVIIPFITLFIQSFKAGTGQITKAFILLKPTILNSLGLAFSASVFIVFIGFVSAYFSNKNNKKSFDLILLIIFAIPSVVLGISFIKFYNRPILDFIYSGYIIILIAYIGKFSFISSKIIGNSLKQIPNSLSETAQLEGVTFNKIIRKIIIPLIVPAIFTSFIIGFIFSLGELGTTIMLYPPGTEIMPIKIFTIMANAPQALTSSMTLIVFAVTIVTITVLFFTVKLFFNSFGYYND